MNEESIALLKKAKAEKRLFFYSWPVPRAQEHIVVEVCVHCDAILVPEKFRDEVENNLL